VIFETTKINDPYDLSGETPNDREIRK